MLAACLCCRKKVPKNELLGLEGMVKIKNPDDQIVITNGMTEIVIDPNTGGGGAINDERSHNEKRVSNAPHRSLPDIPISDPIAVGGSGAGDNGSDLYATVGDKSVNDKFNADRHPNNAIRKLASISQHSSISQADDVSSPYARVKLPSNHAYDQLRTTEHPYAQVTAVNHGNQSNTVSTGASSAGTSSHNHMNNSVTGTSTNPPTNGEDVSMVDGSSRRGSDESLLGGNKSHEDIPAASAIAGRVSASQELPYMTPPIVQQPNHHNQHFSGDSQDSSKGYTSISVREPLANIIAQTNQQNAAHNRRRDLSDSHYATVSDDSDEMYAAIEDPNLHNVDLYTSGSETYAQIQPPPNPNPITIAVEINNHEAPPLANASTNAATRQQNVDDDVPTNVATIPSKRQSVISAPIDDSPVLPLVDNLRTVHSRQASSSSCTSSVGNLGSPKPEKRQANSPLPPTPKNSTTGNPSAAHHHNTSNTSSNGSVAPPSSRNSVASVFESQLAAANSNTANSRHVSRENLTSSAVVDGLTVTSSRNSSSLGSQSRLSVGDSCKLDEDPAKKRNSAKNLEGMYAKVMKKNKLSNAPSPNTSPIPYRKSYNEEVLSSGFVGSQPDIGAALKLTNESDPQSLFSSNLSKSMISPRSRNEYETIDKRKSRGGYDDDTRDPEYETIPADVVEKSVQTTNRLSASSTAGLLALGIHKVSHNSLEIFVEMERNASSPIPPATTTIPHVHIVPPAPPRSASTEPGYETLPEPPSLRNDDPGYETVKPATTPTTSVQHRNSVSTSDYDPNYEVLRHNSSGPKQPQHNTEAGYAKVWDPSSDTTSVPERPILSSDYHDYAKISDRTQRNFILGPSDRIAENDEDPSLSDIYASISTVVERSIVGDHVLSLDLGASQDPDPNYSTISETRTGTSVLDGSGSSTAKTSPSTDSSLTPIDYSTMKNSTSTTTTITLDDERLTMYESLTGSESDPNYESVRYTEVDGVPMRPENPYELLYSSKAAPIAMVEDRRSTSPPNSTNNPTASSTTSKINIELKSSAVEVGDYFQV